MAGLEKPSAPRSDGRHLVAAPAFIAALVLVPANGEAADPLAGRKVWEAQACPTCHGLDGNAVLPGTPHFARGERMEKPDFELLITVANGTNVMPAWKGLLSKSEMVNVVAFIRTLQR